MAGTFTNLLYHLIFSTKHRAPLITDEIREPLYQYIGGILRAEGGTLIEVGGVADHVHLLASLKPTLAVADAVRVIKSSSSKWLHKGAGGERFNWQLGYGAFSVSKSMIGEVRRYIWAQPVHHRKRTFQEELIELLKRHGVEYDERNILD